MKVDGSNFNSMFDTLGRPVADQSASERAVLRILSGVPRGLYDAAGAYELLDAAGLVQVARDMRNRRHETKEAS